MLTVSVIALYGWMGDSRYASACASGVWDISSPSNNDDTYKLEIAIVHTSNFS